MSGRIFPRLLAFLLLLPGELPGAQPGLPADPGGPVAPPVESIDSSGDWYHVISEADVAGPAGSSLSPSYDSSSQAAVLNVTATADRTWRVDVQKSDIAWHPSLKVWVRRTGEGVGIPPVAPVTGGETFLPLTEVDQFLFSGRGTRQMVSLQYRLTGVSIAIPPGTYSTSILFTVTAQ